MMIPIFRIWAILMLMGSYSTVFSAQNQTVPAGTNQASEVLSEEDVKADLDRIFNYLNNDTKAEIVDRTGKAIKNFEEINASSMLPRGKFGINTYEWGVTYAAMLRVAEVSGDKNYAQYTYDRLGMIGKSYPYFEKVEKETGRSGLHSLIDPKWLDDCGSMGAAMIKTSLVNDDLSETLRPVINNAFNFVMYKEYRLENGLLARFRPNKNSVWLDDMYMGVPSIAYMGKLVEKEDPKKAREYYDEAAHQIELFKEIMWVPEKNLFRHGWIEEMEEHPSFHWGRANGWALVAICDVLDVLPENHPKRAAIMELFKNHLKGLIALQSGEGFWHQLLDRNDSYLETSATAMYTYCMAHAINKGWVDALTYGPVAYFGWQAVASKINEEGLVEGTCVGTGMAMDPGFYYRRAVSKWAPHGYGPTILAGAEMIQLLKTGNVRMNDDAIMFYNQDVKGTNGIFEVK